MKTYFIDGNSMHLAGSQIDISDSFFGSEIPESNATDAQRQDAISFWLGEGWMDEGDVVVWDGVRYIVGNNQKGANSMKELNQDAVFMICFAQGQDHLIARREIDFTYCPTLCKSYLKTSSCTPNQLRRLMMHGKNQDFSFSYNGELIENWIVDFNEMAPSVAQIIVADKFPGYEDEDMPEGRSPERGGKMSDQELEELEGNE